MRETRTAWLAKVTASLLAEFRQERVLLDAAIQLLERRLEDGPPAPGLSRGERRMLKAWRRAAGKKR